MQAFALLLLSSVAVAMANAGLPFDIPQPKALFYCDLDFDGRVEMDDLLAIAGSFGARRSASHWNPLADINADGLIDIFDVSLVACCLEQP